MFRALRLDKLIYQALESTLRSLLLERYDEIPALGMIAQSLETLFTRASRFVERIASIPHRIVEGESVIGGGSTPQQPLPTWLGLDIRQHHDVDENHASVEFVARYRLGGGRAQRQHETSRFVREDGQWYYLDGQMKS